MQTQHSAIENDFIGCIPNIPLIAEEFLSLTKNLNASKTFYADIILPDPVLSSRIFSYLNHPSNSFGGDYLSINKGISAIGIQKFKNIVLVFSLYPIFQAAGCVELFKHSLICAFYSKEIASRYNLINPDDAFLLGLLHDIGKVALKNKFKDNYISSKSYNNKSYQEYTLEEEAAKFGYCHSDVSEFICKTWKLPVVIYDAVKFHHFPLNAMLPQAASIIYFADLLSTHNTGTLSSKYCQNVLQYMRISKAELPNNEDEYIRKISFFFDIIDAD